MGRTRTRGAAVLKEGRGGGRLTAYKCVRMCVCQVARCGGGHPVCTLRRAQHGGEMQPKHFTGACPVLEFCAAVPRRQFSRQLAFHDFTKDM